MAALSGKIAVISGASRGIGEAAALSLAREGATVALIARTASDLQRVADTIKAAGGKAHIYPCDLRKGAEAETVAQAILADVGVPDMLVHNAGAGRWLYTEDTSVDEVNDMIALPYLAAFYLTRLFLPPMLKRKSGYILSVNSPVSLAVWPGSAGYAASRWALRGFTEALRADLHGTGLRVGEVIFGKVESNYFAANAGAEERLPRISSLIRVLKPEECGRIITRMAITLRRRKRHPLMLRLFSVFIALMPRLVKYLVRSTGHKRA